MKFILRQSSRTSYERPWEWAVEQGGEEVALSPDSYVTEAEARSAIAKARKAFAGYRFAKVVSEDRR